MRRQFNIPTILFLSILLCFTLENTLFGAGKNKTVPILITRDINGDQIDTQELLKKGPIIVWFWNSCCGLKTGQLKSLKRAHSQYKDKGLSILAVSEDGVKKMAKTKKAATYYDMPFIVVMDKKKNILNQLQAFAVPTLYVIDQSNTILFTQTGFMPGDEKKLEKVLTLIFKNKTE